jgi:hypothetical protein
MDGITEMPFFADVTVHHLALTGDSAHLVAGGAHGGDLSIPAEARGPRG